MNWKDIAIRATKTAIQTAFAVGLLDLLWAGDWAGAQAAGLVVLAAGASVLLNAVYAWAQS